MRLQKFMSLLLSCIMLCLSFQANCLSIYAEALSAAEPTTDSDGTQAWNKSLGTDAYPQFSGKAVSYISEHGEEVYSNTNISCNNHSYVNGICKTCGEYEVPTLENGAYQLSNYGELVWFQQYVDADNTGANAVLTADITANKNLLNKDGSVSDVPVYKWVPIGRSLQYTGTFDGNGHIISGLYSYSDDYYDYCGLFAKMKGTIKNLGIVDSYFGGKNCYHAASFAGIGYLNSVIENCFSDSSVVGSMYCGGIVGQTTGKISNCYYIGKITANSTYSNAISSDKYNRGTLENCYYSSECSLTSSRAEAKSREQFSSGEVCFLLNKKVTDGSQIWYQKLGTDSYPKLNGADDETVYYCYDRSQNKKFYSNTYIACTEHIYENGICLACDSLQKPALENGAYQLENYGELVWFQQYVDAGNTGANAVLTADITANKNLLKEDGSVSDVPVYKWTPIGRDLKLYYTGTFDGNGHIISGLCCNDTRSYCGLFAKMKGTIKNLGIVDSYFGSEKCYHAASFAGYAVEGSVIENCFSDSSVVGYAYCGGIAGETYGKISNCYYIGKITTDSTDSNAISSDKYNYGALENCYYLESCGLSTTRAVGKTAEQFASGDVCYILKSSENNLVWGQNLSSEGSMPVLTSDEELRVYRVTTVKDDASSSYYSNSSCTLPADDTGYWIDENGKVLYSPAKITKDTTITFKQFVSVLGDVNQNGKVEKADAAAVLRHVSGISLISDEAELLLADVNRDGNVDVRDAVEIIKKAAA